MTGNPKVVETLKTALPAEAHLNLQYRLYRRLTKFMGIKKTSKKMDRFADDGHCFLAKVTKQLLFLAGETPGAVAYTMADITEPATLTQLFADAHTMEIVICTAYEKAIPICVTALDDETRNLYEHLIKWHRDHQEWIEKQQRLIAGMGESEYIAEKL